jgi:hypothetical protein
MGFTQHSKKEKRNEKESRKDSRRKEIAEGKSSCKEN